MKRFTHSFFSLFILLVYLTPLLCGCSSSILGDLKTHLTVMIIDSGVDLSEGSIIDNRWTDYINSQMEKYNIEIEFVPVNAFDSDATVRKMMNSGTAADIMIGKDAIMIQNFYPEGYIHNLAEYINPEKTPDLCEFLGMDAMMKASADTDEIWAVRAKRSSTGMNNLFIRKDWLDKLGLEVPTTPDELCAVLKAFSSLPSSMTVTGEKVIPAAFYADGSIGPLCCAFLESISDNGTFSASTSDIYGTMVCSDPGYEKYLKFLNKLYNEHLLANDFIVTQDNLKSVREYFLSGRLGAFEGPVNANIDAVQGYLLQTLRTVCPDADFVSIPALRNINDQKQYSNVYSGGGNYIFLPLSCKNPEAAATYLNWLATEEGGFTLYNGFCGEHYEIVNNTPIPKDCSDNKDKNAVRNSLFILAEDGYFNSYEAFLSQTAAEYPGYEQHIFANYTNSCLGARSRHGYYTYAVAFYGSVYRQICDSYRLNLLTCPASSFDEIAEEFKTRLIDSGVKGMYFEQKNN